MQQKIFASITQHLMSVYYPRRQQHTMAGESTMRKGCLDWRVNITVATFSTVKSAALEIY